MSIEPENNSTGDEAFHNMINSNDRQQVKWQLYYYGAEFRKICL